MVGRRKIGGHNAQDRSARRKKDKKKNFAATLDVLPLLFLSLLVLRDELAVLDQLDHVLVHRDLSRPLADLENVRS